MCVPGVLKRKSTGLPYNFSVMQYLPKIENSIENIFNLRRSLLVHNDSVPREIPSKNKIQQPIIWRKMPTQSSQQEEVEKITS